MSDAPLPVRRSSSAARAARQVILFHHWTMERLAKQLVAHPLYAGRVRLGRCSWECFADATPSIQIDPEDCMAMDTEEHDVAFLASFAEPKLIFEQLALLYAMPRMRARNFRVLVRVRVRARVRAG